MEDIGPLLFAGTDRYRQNSMLRSNIEIETRRNTDFDRF